MKTYKNFNEMFNANSCIKSGLSVFNLDVSDLTPNYFELLQDDKYYSRFGSRDKAFLKWFADKVIAKMNAEDPIFEPNGIMLEAGDDRDLDELTEPTNWNPDIYMLTHYDDAFAAVYDSLSPKLQKDLDRIDHDADVKDKIYTQVNEYVNS